MYKNFVVCPHCAAKGKEGSVRPATAHRSPLVSRSDAKAFHIFLDRELRSSQFRSYRIGSCRTVPIWPWSRRSKGWIYACVASGRVWLGECGRGGTRRSCRRSSRDSRFGQKSPSTVRLLSRKSPKGAKPWFHTRCSAWLLLPSSGFPFSLEKV